MNEPTRPDQPICPKCGEAMALARIAPKAGPLPELYTFHCRDCREATTIPSADDGS